MRVMPVWAGSVIGVGPEIEIRVFVDQHGDVKLGITAPTERRIARKKGPPPQRKRRLVWSRRDVVTNKAAE